MDEKRYDKSSPAPRFYSDFCYTFFQGIRLWFRPVGLILDSHVNVRGYNLIEEGERGDQKHHRRDGVFDFFRVTAQGLPAANWRSPTSHTAVGSRTSTGPCVETDLYGIKV